MKHVAPLLVSTATICFSLFACSDNDPVNDTVSEADGGDTAESESVSASPSHTQTNDIENGTSVAHASSTDATDAGSSAGSVDSSTNPVNGASDASTSEEQELDATSMNETGSGSLTEFDSSDAAIELTTDAGDDGGFTLEVVNLGAAGDYVILAKSGISTTGVTSIVGDIGLSPADATYITGFGLNAPPTSFASSDLVTGKVWASDYDAPTPVNLTEAVLDMENAYTDAAGRTLPDYTELGAGNIDGMTLSPGLYKWGTGVTVPTGVTLEGNSTDVWILQIAQDLLLGNGASVSLSGGVQAENVFWQVAGQATLGTSSSFQGILLSQTLIEFNTGAMMTGRALAQTAVTLDAAVIDGP